MSRHFCSDLAAKIADRLRLAIHSEIKRLDLDVERAPPGVGYRWCGPDHEAANAIDARMRAAVKAIEDLPGGPWLDLPTI